MRLGTCDSIMYSFICGKKLDRVIWCYIVILCAVTLSATTDALKVSKKNNILLQIHSGASKDEPIVRIRSSSGETHRPPLQPRSLFDDEEFSAELRKWLNEEYEKLRKVAAEMFANDFEAWLREMARKRNLDRSRSSYFNPVMAPRPQPKVRIHMSNIGDYPGYMEYPEGTGVFAKRGLLSRFRRAARKVGHIARKGAKKLRKVLRKVKRRAGRFLRKALRVGKGLARKAGKALKAAAENVAESEAEPSEEVEADGEEEDEDSDVWDFGGPDAFDTSSQDDFENSVFKTMYHMGKAWDTDRLRGKPWPTSKLVKTILKGANALKSTFKDVGHCRGGGGDDEDGDTDDADFSPQRVFKEFQSLGKNWHRSVRRGRKWKTQQLVSRLIAKANRLNKIYENSQQDVDKRSVPMERFWSQNVDKKSLAVEEPAQGDKSTTSSQAVEKKTYLLNEAMTKSHKRNELQEQFPQEDAETFGKREENFESPSDEESQGMRISKRSVTPSNSPSPTTHAMQVTKRGHDDEEEEEESDGEDDDEEGGDEEEEDGDDDEDEDEDGLGKTIKAHHKDFNPYEKESFTKLKKLYHGWKRNDWDSETLMKKVRGFAKHLRKSWARRKKANAAFGRIERLIFDGMKKLNTRWREAREEDNKWTKGRFMKEIGKMVKKLKRYWRKKGGSSIGGGRGLKGLKGLLRGKGIKGAGKKLKNLISRLKGGSGDAGGGQVKSLLSKVGKGGKSALKKLGKILGKGAKAGIRGLKAALGGVDLKAGGSKMGGLLSKLKGFKKHKSGGGLLSRIGSAIKGGAKKVLKGKAKLMSLLRSKMNLKFSEPSSVGGLLGSLKLNLNFNGMTIDLATKNATELLFKMDEKTLASVVARKWVNKASEGAVNDIAQSLLSIKEPDLLKRLAVKMLVTGQITKDMMALLSLLMPSQNKDIILMEALLKANKEAQNSTLSCMNMNPGLLGAALPPISTAPMLMNAGISGVPMMPNLALTLPVNSNPTLSIGLATSTGPALTPDQMKTFAQLKLTSSTRPLQNQQMPGLSNLVPGAPNPLQNPQMADFIKLLQGSASPQPLPPLQQAPGSTSPLQNQQIPGLPNLLPGATNPLQQNQQMAELNKLLQGTVSPQSLPYLQQAPGATNPLLQNQQMAELTKILQGTVSPQSSPSLQQAPGSSVSLQNQQMATLTQLMQGLQQPSSTSPQSPVSGSTTPLQNQQIAGLSKFLQELPQSSSPSQLGQGAKIFIPNQPKTADPQLSQLHDLLKGIETQTGANTQIKTATDYLQKYQSGALSSESKTPAVSPTQNQQMSKLNEVLQKLGMSQAAITSFVNGAGVGAPVNAQPPPVAPTLKQGSLPHTVVYVPPVIKTQTVPAAQPSKAIIPGSLPDTFIYDPNINGQGTSIPVPNPRINPAPLPSIKPAPMPQIIPVPIPQIIPATIPQIIPVQNSPTPTSSALNQQLNDLLKNIISQASVSPGTNLDDLSKAILNSDISVKPGAQNSGPPITVKKSAPIVRDVPGGKEITQTVTFDVRKRGN